MDNPYCSRTANTSPLFKNLGGEDQSTQVETPYLYLGPADSGLWFHRHGVFSRRRDCRSAAPPSTFSRRFNMDVRESVSRMTELSPTARRGVERAGLRPQGLTPPHNMDYPRKRWP